MMNWLNDFIYMSEKEQEDVQTYLISALLHEVSMSNTH